MRFARWRVGSRVGRAWRTQRPARCRARQLRRGDRARGRRRDRELDVHRRQQRHADVDGLAVRLIETRDVRVGRRDALHRREVVHRVRERSEIVGAMRGIGDERLAEEHLERLGQARVDVARAAHAGTDGRARHGLVEHRADGEHARARVPRGRRLDELGRERRAVARLRRRDGERGVNAHHAVGPARDRRRMDVEDLAAIVARLQVDADGDEDRDGVVEREASALGATRLEDRTKGFRGRRGVRACC